jgi:hypothetical protein
MQAARARLSRTALYCRPQRHGLTVAWRQATPRDLPRQLLRLGRVASCSSPQLASVHRHPMVVCRRRGLLLGSLAEAGTVRRALAPVQTVQQFQELLQDQHYAARLLPGQGRESAELVALFNGMLSALHDERLKLGEQQGFLDRLLEATPSAVVVFDFDGRVSLRNASALACWALPSDHGDGLWRSCSRAGRRVRLYRPGGASGRRDSTADCARLPLR